MLVLGMLLVLRVFCKGCLDINYINYKSVMNEMRWIYGVQRGGLLIA